jgi:hypothetical protein
MDMNKLLEQINTAATGIKSQINVIDISISNAQRERDALTSGVVSKADFMEYVRADIKRKNGIFQELFAKHIGRAAKQGFGVLEGLAKSELGLAIPYINPHGFSGTIAADAVHYYFSELILQGVEKAANDITFNDEAVPVLERKALIAELDKNLASMRQQRNQLAENLMKAGIQQ